MSDATTTTESGVGEPGDPVEPVDDPGNGVLGPGDDEGDEGGGQGPAGGLTWGRVAVLVAAVAFLGFAVGIFVSQDDPPGEGSVDVGFYRDMIVHHQQALSLATLELADGSNATVRSYAREVLTFQAYEIGVMRQTLSDWGYSPEQQSGEAMAWMDMPVPADQMPGLVSEDQIDAMEAARGREADSLFLDLMAEHHRGGLHMADYAAGHAGDSGVREMGARMVHNQAQEINEYRITAGRQGYDITIEPSDVPPDLPG